jgi:hypothetical protein
MADRHAMILAATPSTLAAVLSDRRQVPALTQTAKPNG